MSIYYNPIKLTTFSCIVKIEKKNEQAYNYLEYKGQKLIAIIILDKKMKYISGLDTIDIDDDATEVIVLISSVNK